MAENINNKPFTNATKTKLKIFGECFKQWFPVFLHHPYIDKIAVFDFFAGSGTDSDGIKGSPLILLETAKGKEKQYCDNANKKVSFIFNEALKGKSKELSQNVKKHIADCKGKNDCQYCKYDFIVLQNEFKSLFENKDILHVLNDSRIAKFVLLDQYGFKEINDSVFKQLLKFPKTDFIFFISSDFISRFEKHPNTLKYIDTTDIEFRQHKPMYCHRLVANHFRLLVPQNIEYYIHHFTIRRNNNYHGLIFGTNHSLGMEKFLKVCWDEDPDAGEANINIDSNLGGLFADRSIIPSVKMEKISNELKEEILNGNIKDNKSGFQWVMQKGCLPKIFTELVKKMEKQDIIKRIGDVNNRSTNIHKAKQYFIKLK